MPCNNKRKQRVTIIVKNTMHNDKKEWCVERENDDVHYTLCTRNLKTKHVKNYIMQRIQKKNKPNEHK
jgi:hypothetical protein